MCKTCKKANTARKQPDFITDVVLTGDYYGYPRCCSYEFAIIMLTGGASREPIQEEFKVHGGWGFIPCANHSQQISGNKIKLFSLIKDRECNTRFPNGGDVNDMSKWVQKKLENLDTKEFVNNVIKDIGG